MTKFETRKMLMADTIKRLEKAAMAVILHDPEAARRYATLAIELRDQSRYWYKWDNRQSMQAVVARQLERTALAVVLKEPEVARRYVLLAIDMQLGGLR